MTTKSKEKTKSRKPLFPKCCPGWVGRESTAPGRDLETTHHNTKVNKKFAWRNRHLSHTVVISYDNCYRCPDQLDPLHHAWCVLQDDLKGLLPVTVHCVVVNDSYPHGFYKISTELNISAAMFVVFVNRCRGKQDSFKHRTIRTNNIMYWQFLLRCTQQQ